MSGPARENSESVVRQSFAGWESWNMISMGEVCRALGVRSGTSSATGEV